MIESGQSLKLWRPKLSSTECFKMIQTDDWNDEDGDSNMKMDEAYLRSLSRNMRFSTPAVFPWWPTVPGGWPTGPFLCRISGARLRLWAKSSSAVAFDQWRTHRNSPFWTCTNIKTLSTNEKETKEIGWKIRSVMSERGKTICYKKWSVAVAHWLGSFIWSSEKTWFRSRSSQFHLEKVCLSWFEVSMSQFTLGKSLRFS